jgi:hypothetical protein
MRELTDAELQYISGGTTNSEDIIVTGVLPTWPVYYPPTYDYGPPYYGGGGGGGGTGTYATTGTTAAANAFADARVHDVGSPTNTNDINATHNAHDVLAKFYDFAKANPNALVTVGDYSLTATQVLNALSLEQIYITDSTDPSVIGPNGAQTRSSWSATTGAFVGGVTYINPNNSNYQTYPGDFAIAHEIGHELVNSEYSAANAPTGIAAEVDANIAARSILTDDGLSVMSNPPLGYTH